MYNTIGRAAHRVVRVVVVDVAARVHVPRIVRVATISTTQADVLRLAYNPFIVSPCGAAIYSSFPYLFVSPAFQSLNAWRTSIVFCPQYLTLLLVKWYRGLAICINASKLLHSLAASCCSFLRSSQLRGSSPTLILFAVHAFVNISFAVCMMSFVNAV